MFWDIHGYEVNLMKKSDYVLNNFFITILNPQNFVPLLSIKQQGSEGYMNCPQ